MIEPARKGLFITFEGLDGSGKTTQMRLLAEHLESLGREVVFTAEPGGTDIGKQIRAVLLNPANQAMFPTAELLLYFASRAQNVDEIIRPALERGAVVVCDRFTDSTLAYQGAARGLGEDVVMALHQVSCRGVEPELTIFLDTDLDRSLDRARSRNQGPTAESRLDDEKREFHERVLAGYLRLIEREPRRIVRIDGGRAPDIVAADVRAAVEERLRVS